MVWQFERYQSCFTLKMKKWNADKGSNYLHHNNYINQR